MLRHCFHRVAMVLALAGAVQGCSKDDKKDPATTATASGGQATVDLSSASAGSQYVLMPFILGDTATVLGATDAKFTFTMSMATGTKLRESAMAAVAPPLAAPAAMTPGQRDHALRTLLNRFDPKAGLDQGEDFWSIARRVDVDAALSAGGGGGGAWLIDPTSNGGVEDFYRNAAKNGQMQLSERFNLATGSCPTAGGSVSAPTPNSPTAVNDLSIPAAATVVSADDYCIVYISEPVTGGAKATIEATIKAVISRYKTVIYKDTFAAVNGYTFKPVFVIIDFTDTALWPSDAAYQVTGAFLANMSDDASMPMLYMVSDTQKLPTFKSGSATYDAAEQKRLWHGTIAHETQHAIMNYYRTHVIKNGTKETAAIDEGLAHYTEDLFGHGGDNFKSFPLNFLQSWYDKDAASPALHATASDSLTRGAAQTLMYYLISQKGGVTFTSGLASGGGGLQYLSDIVKGAKSIGPANLAEKFGGTWTDTIGGFFGALAVDGAGISGTDAKYTAQDPQTVTDLLGNANATYGMHFNKFGGEKVHTWDEIAKDGLSVPEIQYYATVPYLYTVDDPAVKVVFKTKDVIPNTAVAVVKIK